MRKLSFLLLFCLLSASALAQGIVNSADILRPGSAYPTPCKPAQVRSAVIAGLGTVKKCKDAGNGWDTLAVGTSVGDASTNTSSSVDSEIALFSGTGGKTLKRATGSGIVKVTSGVFGIGVAATDYVAPGATTTSGLTMATARILGRTTASTGAIEELTASSVLDIIGSTRGSILYRGASGWAILAPGTSGQFLKTFGAGADPAWADTAASGASAALDNLSSVNINASLIPQTTLNLGAQATPWKELWLYGGGSFASHSIKFTGTPTGHRVQTFPDNTGTVANLNLAQTWTATQTLPATTFTGKLSGSGAALELDDVNGVQASGGIRFGSAANNHASVGWVAGLIGVRVTGKYGFASSATDATGAQDTSWCRNAAGIHEFNRGTCGSNLGAKITAVASGVNYLDISSAATGNATSISAAGSSDTDVSINLVPKGAGTVQANGSAVATLNASINAQTGTTYTIVAADNGKVLTFNNASAITVTVPSGLGAGFNCLIVQLGAGQVTLSASLTTLNNRQSQLKTAGQYAVVSIVAYVANTFAVGGDTGS